jgi:glutathione S-transferase
MKNMLTLYHYPMTRSTRALWMLEEIGCPYILNIVDIRAGEGRDPAYRRLNPHGKVPTLVHDEVVIPDSTAILLYLADQFREKRLAPQPGDPLRGLYLTWMTYTPGVIEPAFAAKRHGHEFDPVSVAWGRFDDMVERLQQGAAAAAPYLLGAGFTAADILIGGAIHFGTQFGLLARTEARERYAAAVTARPAFQRAMAKDAELAKARSGRNSA